MAKKALRAIDVYSGVGGWAVGLRLAGIEIVASYDRWGKANETNFKNNHHPAQTIDVRRLALADLPKDISVVCGSPPCTQFSFSNRGGSGDIADGLEDVIKFLTIVDHVRPKFWAMENVPRLAEIIHAGLKTGGVLRRFAHLKMTAEVINMSGFGVPQSRARCIAGNFDFELLKKYGVHTPQKTLADIVESFAGTSQKVTDPIFGLCIDRAELRDHVIEEPLNAEEVRINRALKTTHHVYNAMSFPDRMDRPVRTLTATCSRVSRESTVIADTEKDGTFRRLTIRERASLQGFPIAFQFYGDSHTQKQTMVGNAIPPAFTYLIGHAIKGTQPSSLPAIVEAAKGWVCPSPQAEDVVPERGGSRYPVTRKFRFAIPSLHMKSGVRFELANTFVEKKAQWRIGFFFGTPKQIISLDLSGKLLVALRAQLPKNLLKSLDVELGPLKNYLESADIERMQTVWSHKGLGLLTPFMLLDKLDDCGAKLAHELLEHPLLTQRLVGEAILAEYGETVAVTLPGLKKLCRQAATTLSGMLIGSLVNVTLELREQKAAALAQSPSLLRRK